MPKKAKRSYQLTILPIDEDCKKYAPAFSPEPFTRTEKKFLFPFFSNVDRPLFVVSHLPEEVIGALSSRYSRSTKSLRRMFLDEYVGPIIFPENEKDWNEISPAEKKLRQSTKRKFLAYISFINKNGGVESVANVQRARKFFDKWLADYGDDSIAEMGTVHLCLEGISNVALQEIVDKRIGLSLIEKSTRYVSFFDKERDGSFKYLVPGEIKKTKWERQYRRCMNDLFKTYTQIAEPYLSYIMERYPQGSDETPGSFKNSRGAKRFDDIRDLLPFATKTNVALSGNGRVYEDLINKLITHPLGELRFWGQAIAAELELVVPSFVTRSKTERGAQVQYFKANLRILKAQLQKQLKVSQRAPIFKGQWVKLLSLSNTPEDMILTSFLGTGETLAQLSEVKKAVKKLSQKQKAEFFQAIFKERSLGKKIPERFSDRFRKVPRAFENANYFFELWGRGGDYRDLHRHRMNTQDRQLFTTKWGFDLEKEVQESPFKKEIETVLKRAAKLYDHLSKVSPYLAQYVVPFGYIQHWYMNLTAREIYWMVELRTGPQGRPFYRMLCQKIARLATQSSPLVFAGLLVDNSNYTLARRESEKKIERKKTELGIKN